MRRREKLPKTAPREASTTTIASSDASTKHCRQCHSEIPAPAKVCFVCKSPQSKAGLIIKWIAGLTAIAPVVLVAWQYAYALYQESRWTGDLKFTQFNSDAGMTILNTGKTPVHISRVVVETRMPRPDGKYTDVEWRAKAIDQLVAANNFLHVPLNLSSAHPHAPRKGAFGSSQAQWNYLVERYKTDACVAVEFRSNEDRMFEEFGARLAELRFVPGIGKVLFYSTVTGDMYERVFPVRGFLSLIDIAGCEATQAEYERLGASH